MFSTDVCGGHAVNFSIDKTRADGASYIYNNKPEERAARMVLTIDIGNTNIVLGGYENGALGFCTRISTDKSLEADQYALELSGILNLYKVAGENIEGAIISSVVPQITDTVFFSKQIIFFRFCLRFYIQPIPTPRYQNHQTQHEYFKQMFHNHFYLIF